VLDSRENNVRGKNIGTILQGNIVGTKSILHSMENIVREKTYKYKYLRIQS
jgi:hypothetical protein